MTAPQIDPEVVIQHLARQLGQKGAELAMTAAALEAANARNAELESAAAEKPAA